MAMSSDGAVRRLALALALRPVLAARREVDATTASPSTDPIVADPTG